MNKTIRLGEMEMEILNLIWTHPDSSVKDIHEWVMATGKKTARTTVLTTMQRVENKGFIKRSNQKKISTYQAVEEKTPTLKKTVKKVY